MLNFFRFQIYIIALCLPLYLLRFKIFWIPSTALELMIYILFALWFFKRKDCFKKLIIKNRSFLTPALLLFISATFSTLLSKNLIISAGIWKAYFLDPLLFLIVLLDVAKSKTHTEKALFFLVLSGILVSIVSVFYLLEGNLTYDNRLKAFYLSPNYLAMYVSSCFILGLYFCSKFTGYRKFLMGISCGLLLIVIYFTKSYGAYLGIGASLLFLIKRHNKKLFCALLLVVFIIAFFLLNFSFKSIFSSHSFASRLMIWKSAFYIIKDHPIIGIGPGTFQKYYLDYQKFSPPYLDWAVPYPHNIFLAFFSQTGVFGFISFLWLIILFFKNTLLKNTPYFAYISGAMIYILSHGLVDTLYWKNDLCIMFWIILFCGIAKKEFKRKAQ